MQDAWRDVFTWPLLVFLLSVCVYPLASSCAHTFSTMSPRARHVCFFFDYGALSFYSLGSAITYSAYVVPDKWVNSTFHLYFVPIAIFNTVVCTALSCYSRLGLPFLQNNHDIIKRYRECRSVKWGRVLRVLAFAYPYLFDNVPLFYRLFVCTGEGCTDNGNNTLHCWHVTLAFLTAFLFATHLPERLAPGCFDYFGHSHQLFHVCGIISTHFQMQAIEADMALRRPWLQTHAPPITFANTVGAGLLCVALSLCVIYVFSVPLYWTPAEKGKHGRKAKTPARASD